MNQLEWMQRQIEKLTTQVNALSTLDKPNRLNAWQPIFQAASYVSATSILFTGADLTTYMTGYVKCRWYQSGWKYGYIASSSLGSGNTTATLVTNTSYTVANAAITDFSISYGNPVDFPSKFSFNASASMVWNGTAPSGSPTKNEYFWISNGVCTVKIYNSGYTAGATNTQVTFTAPLTTIANANGIAHIGSGGTPNLGYCAIFGNTIYGFCASVSANRLLVSIDYPV